MIVHHASTAPRSGGSPHRPGGIGFVNLMTGCEGEPDNFALALVQIDSAYHAPRHRHNFEQVRVMLSGEMQFDHGQVQQEGSVGYFCEGTPYTQQGSGRSVTLLLQVGGASGSGYMSRRQMDAGVAALQSAGHFERGLFIRTGPAGSRHHQDGYEAIWEHVFGRPIAYDRPRYASPVMIRPDAFKAVPDRLQPGVASKHLGRFNERGLELSIVTVEGASRWSAPSLGQSSLLYVLKGRGRIADGRGDGADYVEGTTVLVPRGEAALLQADDATVLHRFGLPSFDDRT